jgi:hypothetical protein
MGCRENAVVKPRNRKTAKLANNQPINKNNVRRNCTWKENPRLRQKGESIASFEEPFPED